jgi:hypothetical protein
MSGSGAGGCAPPVSPTQTTAAPCRRTSAEPRSAHAHTRGRGAPCSLTHGVWAGYRSGSAHPATPRLPAAFPTQQLRAGLRTLHSRARWHWRGPRGGTRAARAPWRCDGAQATSARGYAGRAVWCSFRRRPRLTEHWHAGGLEEEHVLV